MSSTVENTDKIIENTIFKVIFYSSVIEGNKLSENAAKFLIENNFIKRDSKLKDYIELINHETLYKEICKLKDREVNKKDILQSQNLLFKDILGAPIGERSGPGFIHGEVIPSENSPMEKLDDIVQILNRPASSKVEALVNAIEFHLRMVHAHPFEDGNGRISRLFMNLYLLKNGMWPLLITEKDKPMYFDSLIAYHSLSVPDFFFSTMLNFYLRQDAKIFHELEGKLTTMEQRNLPFADTFLINAGAITPDKLQNDINLLLNSSDSHLKIGALWLLKRSKIEIKDTSSVVQLLKDKDPRVKTAALWLLGSTFDSEDYGNQFNEVLLQEGDNDTINILGLDILGVKHMITPEIIEKIIHRNKKMQILQLCNVMRYIPKYDDELKYVYPLLNSNSRDIKIKAYQAIIDNARESDIEPILSNLKNESTQVLNSTMYRIMKDFSSAKSADKNRLNEGQIPKILIGFAKENNFIRDILLSSLADSKEVNTLYIPFIESIIDSKESTAPEKAYAIYILGKSKTYEDICNKHNINNLQKNSAIVNTALFLVLMSREPKFADVEKMLDIDNSQFINVATTELSQYVSENRFEKHFLSLLKSN